MSGISAIYIVENAQGCLLKSISSIKRNVDEIVVVDIGSIDRTVEVAKALGAKVFKFKGSISDAKKFAVEKSSKSWLLYLNPEEKIYSKKIKQLKNIVRASGSNVAYSFSIMSEEFSYIGKEDEVRLCNRRLPSDLLGMTVSSAKKQDVSLKKVDIDITTTIIGVLENKPNHVSEDNNSISECVNEKSRKKRDKCAIVVVVHNLLGITKDCISHIQKNTKYPYNLYIVDNGSTDKRLLKYLKSINGAKVISIKNNVGVANGRNEGIREALKDKENKYICLLDNDTKTLGSWLTPLVDFVEKNEDCGMVGPVTDRAQGTQAKVSSKWLANYTVNQIINLVKKSDKKNYEKANYLNRFCQVFRTDLISKVGYFDSFGLVGWEDYDYCKRLNQHGYNMYVCKNSIVSHVEHATTRGNKLNYQLLVNKSHKNYLKKWNDDKYKVQIKNTVKLDDKPKEPTSPATSIVVLTYNNLEINKRFFSELKKNTTNYELIVVDNGSTDGTVELLKSLSDVNEINRLVLNDTNLGVIKARNVGIKLSSYEYVICLDNDQIVKSGWLTELHKEMSKGNDFVGVEAWRVNKQYMPIMRYSNRKQAYTISYVGAGGCLMKRAVLEDIGIYDERFGMAYFEDVDICFRAKEAGYKIGWCDKSIINHLEHQTLIHGQKDFNYSTELEKSHKLFYNKMQDKNKGIKFNEIKLTSHADVIGKRNGLELNQPLQNLANHKKKYKLGIVIPYRGKYKVLKSLCHHLSNKDVVYCVMSLGDEDGRVVDLCHKYNLEYLYLDWKGVFNIGKCMNFASQRINCDYFLTQDVDCFPRNNFYENLLKHVDCLKAEGNPFAFSVLGVYYANKEFSKKYLNKDIGDEVFSLIDSDKSYRELENFCGSMPLVKRETFLSIGGIHNGFSGHGAEDLFLVHQLNEQYGKYKIGKNYPGYGTEASGLRSMISFYNRKTYRKGLYLIHKYHERNHKSSYLRDKMKNWNLLYDLIDSWDNRLVVYENHPFLNDSSIFDKLGGKTVVLKDRDEDKLEDLFKNNNVKCFVHVNPYLHNNQKLIAIAKKYSVKCYCVERGALMDTMFFDPNGFNVMSDSYNARRWDKELNKEQKSRVRKYIDAYINDSDSLEKQPERNRISKGAEKILFVPLQVPTDTVIKYHSDWVNSVSYLVSICEEIAENTNWKIWLKRHPIDKSNYKTKHCEIVNYHFKDILDICDCVMTINSGVGLQSLLWGKPCLVLGDCFYDFENLTMKANNKKDIIKYLSSPQAPNEDLVEKFIYYLKYEFYSDVTFYRTYLDYDRGATSKITYNNIRLIE